MSCSSVMGGKRGASLERASGHTREGSFPTEIKKMPGPREEKGPSLDAGKSPFTERKRREFSPESGGKHPFNPDREKHDQPKGRKDVCQLGKRTTNSLP